MPPKDSHRVHVSKVFKVKKRNPIKINKTNIARILRESIFDPKIGGPMKVIVDTGNYDYLLRRVREILANTLHCVSAERENSLKMAISLLATARLLDAKSTT